MEFKVPSIIWLLTLRSCIMAAMKLLESCCLSSLLRIDSPQLLQTMLVQEFCQLLSELGYRPVQLLDIVILLTSFRPLLFCVPVLSSHNFPLLCIALPLKSLSMHVNKHHCSPSSHSLCLKIVFTKLILIRCSCIILVRVVKV